MWDPAHPVGWELARSAGEGKQTDLILLNFSKAFDMVIHTRLIWKLHEYGICSNVLNWIHGFLCDRSQRVVVAGEESGSVPVISGVPSGLILFLVYMNDLPDNITSQVRLFADDTVCISSWRARMTVRFFKGTWTNCLCGRLTETWSLTLEMPGDTVTGSRKPLKPLTNFMLRVWRPSPVQSISGLISQAICHGAPSKTGLSILLTKP